MTKDRLRSLSYTELFRIAEQGNITVLHDMDKESLIASIFEALEDDRLDREDAANLTIQLEAKKFTVSQDEEFFIDFAEDVELSGRYMETSLVLMLRDPSWVYCYWDIEDRILSELSAEDDYEGLLLRVIELTAPEWGGESEVDRIDIPIQFGDLSRYINLPGKDAFYGVELYAQLGEREMLIARSNIVEGSRDYIADAEDGDGGRCDQLIQLSGFSNDIGSFPGSAYTGTDTPQRIIGVRGEDKPR